ncbi:probable rRNA-processing protein EBP2 [Acanthaster planci]|uniref:Probable rRNA-processing protein EBP2 n=1 Tax=Acanthaster planci TaxID=133434 RepID=A0A8B7YXL9_ACAPL|nr:probable rRNA-processing protein EBP2 [Acanthaster planci]XP_022097235.1 probable rRNA-processing protein EBP2 [Acanthaster planci]
MAASMLARLPTEHVGEADSDDYNSSSGEESENSDTELQKAFAKGYLKPGLNVVTHGPKKCINDVVGITEALAELQQDLPWVERLDIVNEEVGKRAADEEEEEQEELKRATSADDVHNDFKREMKFYRQGQAAVLEAVPRLQKLGFCTKRPEDYFAEMAKSDEHMRKVRKRLIGRQLSIERSEKAKKLRELKKFGKKVQHEVLLKRQKEKKELMESVKKFRRGKKDALDILEDLDRKPGNRQTSKRGVPDEKTVNKFGKGKKRQYRDEKFGEGGKKRGSKRNTKESAYDESRGQTSLRIRDQGASLFKPGKKYQVQRKKQMKRLGKARRRQAKSRRKK